MPYFKKRPIVIEAVQYLDTPEAISALIRFVPDDVLHLSFDGFQIVTLEGLMNLSLGDWVIRGVQDEYYPCKRDIFVVTYEEVENGESG